jgi:putative transposase
VLDGKVITMCKPRHRHQEFLSFLGHLDRNVPPGLDIHLVADNYSPHKHPKVKAWLARRPRYHFHYTPTYASWLNQVERWFGLITQQAIRRGSFRSVGELVQKIDTYVANYNLHKRPSYGLPPPIPFSLNFSDCVHLLMGHYTRNSRVTLCCQTAARSRF